MRVQANDLTDVHR